MKSRELIKQLDQINLLLKQTTLSTNGNIELQGHWGKYICILVSGFLENAISEVYMKFVTEAASPPVARYTVLVLQKIQNPNSKKFIETASNFKSEWGEQLNDFFSQDTTRKDAIDSIMKNRHAIAHDKNTSISVAQVQKYFEKCVEVIDFIESQCAGNAMCNNS